MKHYLWYYADGTLGGEERFSGGFPDTCDPRDPNTTDGVALSLRAARIGSPNFGGWLEYACGCHTEAQTCPCPTTRVGDSFSVNGAIAGKIQMTMMLDGVPVTSTSMSNPLNKTPGSSLSFYLSAAVPDGHQIVLGRSLPLMVSLIQSETTLTFNGGQTAPVQLIVPAQGFTAGIYGISKYIKPFYLHLRGWTQ